MQFYSQKKSRCVAAKRDVTSKAHNITARLIPSLNNVMPPERLSNKNKKN